MGPNSFSGAGSTGELYVCTWNLAGIAVRDVNLFIEQLSDNYAWDFVMLQETFTQAAGIELEGNHELFVSSLSDGGLRQPAILVHQRWASFVRVLRSAARWIAIEFNTDTILVSLHLPHSGRPLEEFISCLHELSAFLSTLPSCVYIGMDANTSMHSAVDFCCVGNGVVQGDMAPRVVNRAVILHEFLASHRLFLANTFTDVPNECLITHSSWSSKRTSQFDFVALPWGQCCFDSGVDQSLVFSCDHKLVWARLGTGTLPSSERKRRTPRNWKPALSWYDACQNLPWNWSDWTTTSAQWQQTALDHSMKACAAKDEVLADLLSRRRSCTDPSERKRLNRWIWRHRRWKRRKTAKQTLRSAAETGSMPKTRPTCITTNWDKLCEGADPKQTLHDYFYNIYSLDDEHTQRERDSRAYWRQFWLSSGTGVQSFVVTVEKLQKAVAKLKNGKSSPDGCTAELYKQLPPHVLEGLACFFTVVLATLTIPDDWTVVGAMLIPKVVGAASLSKFRAIACLPTARKLLGYLWMQTLPPLVYLSFQCGFIPSAQAANGVYVINRAAELSREWKRPMFVAQLDLSKAFDRVFHSAVFKALRLQSASAQCLAILSAILSQSKMAVSLGHVAAPFVHMERGLPQGAPESPLIFTLVTELVLRPLLARWKTRGSGWTFDAFFLAAVCYADDIILVSQSKSDLERMILETTTAFAEVGLSVSTEKCHWSCHPMQSGCQLQFGADAVVWEDALTFVGTVLDLNGNDARAIAYRMAQATKVFHKWKDVLRCRDASEDCRIRLVSSTVFSALLWAAETWHPNRRQQKMLESFGARIVAKALCIKPLQDEDVGDYWRRFHRIGHRHLSAKGGGVNAHRRRRLHAFAGHLGRANGGIQATALRTRSLAWWRHFQGRRLVKHPGRFAARRWEEQLVAYYGEANSVFVDEDVGWMLACQDRGVWRSHKEQFAVKGWG